MRNNCTEFWTFACCKTPSSIMLIVMIFPSDRRLWDFARCFTGSSLRQSTFHFFDWFQPTLSCSILGPKVQTSSLILVLHGWIYLASVHIPNDCLAILILFCWFSQLYDSSTIKPYSAIIVASVCSTSPSREAFVGTRSRRNPVPSQRACPQPSAQCYAQSFSFTNRSF